MAKVNIDKSSWEKGFKDGESGLVNAPIEDEYSYISGYIEGKAVYEEHKKLNKLVQIETYKKKETSEG